MKKWYQSKTIWLNLIAILLGVIPMIDADFLTNFGVTNVKVYLSVLGIITYVLNTILRLVTTKSISSKKEY